LYLTFCFTLLLRSLFFCCFAFFVVFSFFFFNDPAPTDIYTLSLHDALPICPDARARPGGWKASSPTSPARSARRSGWRRSTSTRSEEHTSELQSRSDLVCRLLLEKKKKKKKRIQQIQINKKLQKQKEKNLHK